MEVNSDLFENTLTTESLLDYLCKKASEDNYVPPIYETELLQNFFTNYETIMKSSDPLNMFKMHFILYHYLYKLKSHIMGKDLPYCLHIHLASVYFLFHPPQHLCPYFEESRLSMCLLPKDENEPYCQHHTYLLKKLRQGGILQSQALENYYLDINNIEAMTQEELDYMLSTWKALCSSPDELVKCYQILQLEPGADLKTVTAQYHYLAKQYHPDVSQEPGSHQKMNQINEAYNLLKEHIKAHKST